MRDWTRRRRLKESHPVAVEASEADIAAMERAADFTMTGPERQWALIAATRYVLRTGVTGAFVECGVWKGGSAMLIMDTVLNEGADPREIWLYDTFDGMTSPSEIDREVHTGRSAEELLRDPQSRTKYLARASLAEVQANLASTRYPSHLVRTVQGDVSETVRNDAPSSISLLRLDTDWYESTRVELEELYPLVSPGGVVIVDDYGHFAGAKAAVDHYLTQRGLYPLLFRIDYTARMWVK